MRQEKQQNQKGMLSQQYHQLQPQYEPYSFEKNCELEVRNFQMGSEWCEFIPVIYNSIDHDEMSRYRPGNNLPFKENKPVYRREISYMPLPRQQHHDEYRNEFIKNQTQYDHQFKRYDIKRPENYKEGIFSQVIDYTAQTDQQRRKALDDFCTTSNNEISRQNQQSIPKKQGLVLSAEEYQQSERYSKRGNAQNKSQQQTNQSQLLKKHPFHKEQQPHIEFIQDIPQKGQYVIHQDHYLPHSLQSQGTFINNIQPQLRQQPIHENHNSQTIQHPLITSPYPNLQETIKQQGQSDRPFDEGITLNSHQNQQKQQMASSRAFQQGIPQNISLYEESISPNPSNQGMTLHPSDQDEVIYHQTRQMEQGMTLQHPHHQREGIHEQQPHPGREYDPSFFTFQQQGHHSSRQSFHPYESGFRFYPKESTLDQYIYESNLAKQRIEETRMLNRIHSEEHLFRNSHSQQVFSRNRVPFYEVQGLESNKFYASPNLYRYSKQIIR